MSDDDKRQMIVRIQLSQAIERYISVPENLKERLAPMIEKLDRFHSSWMFKLILRGELESIKEAYIRKEVADFLQFADIIPAEYKKGLDSQLDLLQEGNLRKNDLVRMYSNVVLTLKMYLIREIHRKYEKAIKAILVHRETEKLDLSDEEVKSQWLAPRQRDMETLRVSDLPEVLLKKFSLEDYSGTLDELSLEKIREVACSLASEFSLGE